MKKISTLLSIALFSLSLNAQNYCGSSRYDTEVFSTVNVTSNITYGSNTSVNGNPTTLTMDIYEPAGDTASIRPLIVFAHGGSFLGGSKTDADQVSLCNHFAKRGYVCATINYRVGMGFPINEANAKKAVWRATQDMKAAIRFFRMDAATMNTYKIDPNMIFAGGTSAGAFMALHHAYLDQPSEIPAEIDTTAMGGIEGNSGNPNYPSTVKAIVNLCGALGDADFIVPGDVPMVSLHGTNDNTVPYGTAMLYIGGSFQIMVVDGSRTIHERANNIGITNKFYTWYGQDHVPYAGTSAAALAYMDTTVRFVSNFLYEQLSCTPTNSNPQPNPPAPSGINDHDSFGTVSISPNPAMSSVTIKWEDHVNTANITFFDMTGRAVKTAIISANQQNVNIEDLAPGIYSVQLGNEKIKSAAKLVITR
jgi:poly(3-hydroxybutyrate) depolymerase